MSKRKTAILLAASCALAGCANNAATIDIAKGVSERSTEAMRGVATYFDDIESKRQRTAAAVVASDPSCLPEMPLKVQRPSQPRGKQGPLCRTNGLLPGYDADTLDFSTAPDDVLKPRLVLVAAVADYGTALGKIAVDPAADVKGELTSFAEKVDRVASFMQLVGYDGPTLGGQMSTEEGKAVLDLLQFAAFLRHEADQARNIHQLVEQRGVAVDKAIAELTEQIDVWGQGDLSNVTYEYVDALERAYKDNRYRMSFAERQAAAQTIFEAQSEERALPKRSRTVLAALGEVQKAQQELRQALLGNYSEKRRRQIAKENFDRITRALGMIATLGKAI